ncbi:hypothetical protein [Candidatus Phytoplasma ziziphi]|uniref:hypothetical protein n=1 Tax=Ziziphus jujuba witches'-broom phytoplasma TaxID=135727 RepID=UPI002A4E1A7D|nr:hypothetical protein [Candidatus Phytoplasma ziziphi]
MVPKDPPSGLMAVYFKPRSNPFKIKYPAANNKHTLEDLLKYEIAIEEAFVFWDAQQKTQEEKCNVQLININLFVDQSKEEAINNYLIQQKIIQKPKLIKLGCYNATPNTGLVVPFPLGGFLSFEFEAIYFDDGIRLLPQLTYTIEDLLKLSNGAKMFIFSLLAPKKELKASNYLMLLILTKPFEHGKEIIIYLIMKVNLYAKLIA